jgi:mono/diheme cytochrome c family protein
VRPIRWSGIALALVACFFAGTEMALPPRIAAATQATGHSTPDTSHATPATDQKSQQPADSPRALLDKYCVSCHNARLKTAGLVLDRDAADAGNVATQGELWEKVLRKVRTQAMPPAGSRRPSAAEYATLTTSLEHALDAAAAAHPNPGRPTAHRLNRAEYALAIRDLLGVDVDVRSMLPADDSGYGFDNVADVLSVSPGLLERYMLAAGHLGRVAVGDPTIPVAIATYRVPPLAAQTERMSEDLPFASRGGLSVRHTFPVDGEYVLKVRLQRTYTELIRGMTDPHQLEVRVNRRLVKQFEVGGLAGRPAGDLLKYLQSADEDLEVRFAAKAGSALVAADFVKEPKLAEGIYVPPPPLASFEFSGKTDSEAAIDSIQITGPYNGTRPEASPSRQKIFVCQPAAQADEPSCARRIVSTLARRAYRRPVKPEEVDALLRLYEQGRAGGGFDNGIEWVIERVLVAPDFLFRIEPEPANAQPGTPYRISDVALASRLSFFLWSSIPDDELLGLAERGRLHEPSILDAQVRRMLADDRSGALITNFAGQWLYLRNLRGHAPDPDLFVDFDDNLREAFQRETELFLQSQLREDHSVIDLLRANYTFVNERLARHYGIPGIYGSHFRRVVLPDDRRAGLLGQGSILTVTSYAHRTSPVVRGKWLLENLLGAPPPPPPANVPALKENNEGGRPASVRERLEEHRKNPVCASCHARMDPLGFALENFDAIGRWRSVDESGKPVDASGVLPDGTRFDGPAEFRRVLLAHADEFVTTVTEKLLTYALGRGLESYDMPAVRAILRQAKPDEDRWSSLIRGIVASVPFENAMPVPRAAVAADARRVQE